MLKPKPLTVTDTDGEDVHVILTRFPATDGREIVAGYPVANIPKLGEGYARSEEVMLKLMSFVYVEIAPGQTIPLNTRALVNNHCHDFEALMKIEMAALSYNCSFFRNGLRSTFFANIEAKAHPLISQILTAFSAQLSPAAKQPSENSKPSTT